MATCLHCNGAIEMAEQCPTHDQIRQEVWPDPQNNVRLKAPLELPGLDQSGDSPPPPDLE